MKNTITSDDRLSGFPIENSVVTGELSPRLECEKCDGAGEIEATFHEARRYAEKNIYPQPVWDFNRDERHCKARRFWNEWRDKGMIPCRQCEERI